MAVISRMPPSWFDHYRGKAIVAVLKVVATCSADVGIPQHSLTVDLQKKIGSNPPIKPSVYQMWAGLLLGWDEEEGKLPQGLLDAIHANKWDDMVNINPSRKDAALKILHCTVDAFSRWMNDDDHFFALLCYDEVAKLKSDTASYFRHLVNAIVVTEVTEEAICWALPVDINKEPGDIKVMLSKPLQLESWPLQSQPALSEPDRPTPSRGRMRKHGEFLEDAVLDLVENAVR